MSQRPPATGAKKRASTALRLVGHLDVLSTTPPVLSRRAPCVHALLRALATKGVEISGLLALLGSVAVAGCGGAAQRTAQLGPAPVYLSADAATLIQRANAWASSALQAKGELRLYWSGDEDSRHVNVQLFATSTGALRLNGKRSLVGTIFNLVGNGVEFQLSVPDHGAHYTGTGAAPAEPDPERPYFALRPHHMTEALLPELLPTTNAPDSFVMPETYPSHYSLVWMEADGGTPRIRRKVWIDRENLRVSQIEGFDADGRIEFIATYSNYMGGGIDAYPGRIEVERPWEEMVFRFDLTEADRNPLIPAVAFRFLDLPSGYRQLTIEEAMAEFRRSGGD